MLFFSSKVSVYLCYERAGGQKKKRLANYKSNLDIKSKNEYSVDGFPKVFVYLFDVRVGREGGVWRSQIQFDGPQLHMAAPTCLRMRMMMMLTKKMIIMKEMILVMMLTMKMIMMEETILMMIFLNKLICSRAFA